MFALVFVGLTNTLLSVVLVDLMGVANIARCLALFHLTIAFGFLTGSPFVGLYLPAVSTALDVVWKCLTLVFNKLDCCHAISPITCGFVAIIQILAAMFY